MAFSLQRRIHFRTPDDAPAVSQFGLTPKQQTALAFIRSYIGAHGVSPSYDEICAHMAVTSKSNAHRIVQALRERGHIRVLPGRARSMVLTAPAESLVAS